MTAPVTPAPSPLAALLAADADGLPYVDRWRAELRELSPYMPRAVVLPDGTNGRTSTVLGILRVAAELADPYTGLVVCTAEQLASLSAVNRRTCRLSLQWAHTSGLLVQLRRPGKSVMARRLLMAPGLPVEVDELALLGLLPDLLPTSPPAAP